MPADEDNLRALVSLLASEEAQNENEFMYNDDLRRKRTKIFLPTLFWTKNPIHSLGWHIEF